MQLSGFEGSLRKKFIHCGGNGLGVPPVPIPNTEVKTFSADGTWLDTARESRSPPDSKGKRSRDTPLSDIPQ